MVWFKRITLFLMTNILIMVMVSAVTRFFGLDPYVNGAVGNYQNLFIICLLWGTIGSFISLMLSKVMAKWMMGVKIVDNKSEYAHIVQMVHRLSKKAGLSKMPEVGVFQSPEINAFATGPSRSNSLVAVSTGLLQNMNEDEVEGVIGHEIAHIANGDMVTMAILQGIINAFVMFFARIVATLIDNALKKDDDGGGLGFLGYFAVVTVLEIVFGLLGSMVVSAFSRFREFRADHGGAKLAGKAKMIAALERLQKNYQVLNQVKRENESFSAFQISSKNKFLALLSTHPSLDIRIKTLQRATNLL